MAAKYETGSYYNRGFVGTDPLGFCAYLDSWLTASVGSGGAGWTLVDDYSTPLSATFTISGAPWYCYSVGHGLFTGQEVNVICSGYPTGLAVNTTYFVIKIDNDNFGLATTLLNALAGTNTITGTGSGTRTFYSSPFKVYCNVSTPLINQAVKFIRVLYNSNITATGFTNAIRIMGCLWWDTTNHIPRGVWNQYYLSVITGASPDFYYFVGNDQYLAIVSKNGSTYNQYNTGTWIGDSNLIDPISSIGTLQSGITAGSGVVCTLGTGEASNFSANKYYFIYDFNAHSWVDYVRCQSVDIPSGTITLQIVNYNFPAGSVIGAYPHRFYAMSTNTITTGTTGNSDNVSYSKSTIPYISSTSGSTSNVFHAQTSLIRPSCYVNCYLTALTGGDPDDEGYYYTQIPIISEYHRGDGTLDLTGLRVFGRVGTGDLYVTSVTNLIKALTLRSVGGVNYIYYNITSEQFTAGGDSNTVVLTQAQST